MLFNDLSQLPAPVETSDLRQTEALWQSGGRTDGNGWVPLCNLVFGCGAPAATFIHLAAARARKGLCAGFHPVEVVADAVACWMASAMEIAAYQADLRDRYEGDTWTPGQPSIHFPYRG
ncbi:hypothetical protein [Streptomyces sp. NPDC054975]